MRSAPLTTDEHKLIVGAAAELAGFMQAGAAAQAAVDKITGRARSAGVVTRALDELATKLEQIQELLSRAETAEANGVATEAAALIARLKLHITREGSSS